MDKDEQIKRAEAYLSYLRYSRGSVTVSQAMRPSSEPVSIGDTIKALLSGGLLIGGILKGSSHEQ